ncbi:MAG TPA: hypothetical protein VNB06_22425, partial [Thermoanaerobaculia bacterium]|nr:hypothetical protein [Thermoanaerobaculia bacterium]
ARDADCGEGGAAIGSVLADPAVCQRDATSPPPSASPLSELDPLAAELLAMLIAACGEDATLPDLTGLDDSAATALVEALVTECEAALTLP